MKKILMYTIALVAIATIVGCGGSNGENYTITDDGNGTKSPRIVKTLEESFNDGNLTNSLEYNYTYDSQNLLVRKEGFNDITTYTYNTQKQLTDSAWHFFGGGSIESFVHYNYSHAIFMQGKNLPVVESRIGETSTMFQPFVSSSRRFYTYELDENGRAAKLISVTIESTGSTIHYKYDSENKLIGIVDEDGDETVLTYTKFGAIASKISSWNKTKYIYDKNHLLRAKEYYSKVGNDEWKLTDKTTYFYENKPYYKAPSLLVDDDE